MKHFLTFLQYHNAVPLAFGILFLGGGAALASTPAVQEAVYQTESNIISIDNTRIVSVDVSTYPFLIQITEVTEDEENYYVAYTIETIELVDSVWQDTIKQRSLSVNKDLLRGRDLGLYVTEELSEIRFQERRRLEETQEIEKRNGISQKQIATVYTGLVGQIFDPVTETLPGYSPVIPEPVPAPREPGVPVSPGGGGVASGPSGVADTTPPSIMVLGDAIVRIPLGAVYVDLGAAAYDERDGDIEYLVFVDGVAVPSVSLDTSRVRGYLITYRAIDGAGNVAEASREVVVEDRGVTTPPAIPPTTPSPTGEPSGGASSTPKSASDGQGTGTSTPPRTPPSTEPSTASPSPQSENGVEDESDSSSISSPSAPSPVSDPAPEEGDVSTSTPN